MGDEPIDDDRFSLREQYRVLRPKYAEFCSRVSQILGDLTRDTRIHQITSRAKDEDSFFSKAIRRDKITAEFIYAHPLMDIEDLAGVRVICYADRQVDEVCSIVKDAFEILESLDKAAELRATGKLGYVSKHFIAKFSDKRLELPDYAPYEGMKCEIQVRTVFQHAWAEVEHRLQYKSDSPNIEMRSRFLALAGMVQIADREFDALFDLDQRLTKTVGAAMAAAGQGAAAEANLADNDEKAKPSHRLHTIAYMFGVPPAKLVEMGQTSKAITVYNELIEAQPTQPWHFLGRARARAVDGDFEQALADLDLIDALNSTDGRVAPAVQRVRRTIDGLLGLENK